MFSVDQYNSLPLIHIADKSFHNELTAAGLSNVGKLFADPDLRNLFLEGGRFGMWLLHRHFPLNPGELMVAEGNITEPTTDTNIIASSIPERWHANGNPLEFIKVQPSDAATQQGPSDDFMAEFRRIMQKYNITTLGVCLAPSSAHIEDVRNGYMYVETTDSWDEKRQHIVHRVRADDLAPFTSSGNTFESSWTIDGDLVYKCNHTCVSTGCLAPPSPAPPLPRHHHRN